MKLLLTGAYPYTEDQTARLQALGFDTVFVQDERVPVTIDVSEFEAVVCNCLFLNNDITAFKKLKYIQLTSAGLDRVPLDYIKEHGIKVYNATGVYSIPIAEWTVLKILEIYKKSKAFFTAQQEKKWSKQRGLFELTGKKAAILGFGSVGMEIAKRLKPFDVDVTAVETRMLCDTERCLADCVCLPCDADKALSESDIVIIALPLTGETEKFINADRIELMKDDSVLINISRGAVIDEDALAQALAKGKFLGASLDVFTQEPLPADNPLWGFDQTLITPHNSFVSDKTNDRLFELIENNLSTIASG